jgi:hypothetical protein
MLKGVMSADLPVEQSSKFELRAADTARPLAGKWLQTLKEIAPAVTRVALLFNPDVNARR